MITRTRVIREAVSNIRALAQILYHPDHQTLIKQQKHLVTPPWRVMSSYRAPWFNAFRVEVGNRL
ncbi:MAG TPA: hypothetical protein VE155_10915, partial [Pseudonocardiaceae bacterium]|nr:hypothetical protein [Pseudonocardiaceae bacterium]